MKGENQLWKKLKILQIKKIKEKENV